MSACVRACVHACKSESQCDETRTRQTGLGKASVGRIMEIHRGVWIEGRVPRETGGNRNRTISWRARPGCELVACLPFTCLALLRCQC